MKKWYLLIGLCATLALGACSTPPKGAEARAYARVNNWRDSLDLRGLEQQYDLPKGLLPAVMHQESRGIANARSRVGAQGLFQIMPATARDLNLTSAYLPEAAAQAAAKYLAQLYKHYDGNLKLTLAAYNWGIGNVDRNGAQYNKMPQETQTYIVRVMQLRQFYN